MCRVGFRVQGLRFIGLSGLWLAVNGGMETNMETSIRGYQGLL